MAKMIQLKTIPFSDRAIEQRFLTEFRSKGFGTLVACCGLWSIWTVGIVLAEAISPSVGLASSIGWVERVIVLSLLFVVCWTLIFQPEIATTHHALFVRVPVVACLMIAGLATHIVDSVSVGDLSFRIVSTMILGSIGVYTCTRSRLSEIGLWVILANLVAVAGLARSGEQTLSVPVLYLVVANLVGCLLCLSIEQRERELFSRAEDLKRLSGLLALRAEIAEGIVKSRDKLVRTVAHDMRQPLSAIQLILRGASQSNPHIENLRRRMNEVELCVDELKRAVDTLLLQKTPLRTNSTHSVQVLPMVADAVRRIEYLVMAKGAVRLVTFRAMLPEVVTESGRLASALMNILDNAVKYSRDVPGRTARIQVTCVVLENSLRVEVRDNGRGISNENIARVFEAGWRADADEAVTPGVGYGGAIVKEFANDMPDHRVEIKSREGIGTRVRLYLPRVDDKSFD